MKRQSFVRKGASIIGMVGLLCVSMFTSCTKDNPTAVEQKDPSYSFSGFIIDANTGKALGGAVVTYFDAEGDSVKVVTGEDGGFNIPGIPYGNRSFFFKYTSTDSVKYTTAAITIEGNNWENFVYNGLGAGVTTTADTVIGGIRNVAGPVKLYPLSGSLTGTALAQLHDRAALVPIKNAVVKVTFDPAANLDQQGNNDAVIGSNIEVGPSAFEVMTDSTGKFTLTGLPVSGDANEKVTIKIVSVTSGGIDWVMSGGQANGLTVELASNQSVPVGAIIMNPIPKVTLTDLDNNFKTGVVTPDQDFIVTYSDSLDSVSYAVLSYTDNVSVKRNVPVTITIAGLKLTVSPLHSLINETAYTLNVYAYGKKGQSTTDSFSVTVAGGGLADVISSNVLTSTKSPVYNFGVKTPITFTFADTITGNPSVQVTGAGNDITVAALASTLTITPLSTWKNGIINVNIVLANGTTVRLSTPLNVENSLNFVESNIYDFNSMSAKNGLTLTTPIVFTANKDLSNANVILKDSISGVSLPTTVLIPEGYPDQVQITPFNLLKAARTYTLIITIENLLGESKSQTVNFTTTAAQFYAISDNIRIGNDATLPRLDFAPNANIVIVMNKKVFKATARLNPAVNVQTTISGDSIIIDPEDILTEGTPYDLYVTAEDSVGSTMDGAYVIDFVPRAIVIVMASNIITANNQPITNAAKDISPWFKLSSAPVAANMKVIITNPSVDAVVTVSGDTLVVNPVSDFAYDATPTVTVTGEATDGNYISFSKAFTVLKKPQMSVVASNVLNSNYEGLTNIAEDVEVWYKVSRIPVAASVLATVNVGSGNENAVTRVSGDTIFVKFTRNFVGGTQPVVRITGLDNEGISFTLNGDGTMWPDFPGFTVRQALFPIASNTWDVSDLTAENFTVYGEMWVKWSQPLSTDLTTITWSNGPANKDLYGDASQGQPNATVRVSGDTLFVTPINTRITLSYNDYVGFQVAVTGTKGQVSNATSFQVNYAKSDLYVTATNTTDASSRVIDTFGVLQTAYLVSSQPIAEVTSINDVGGNMAAANELVARTVRLSGDTIFFTPFDKLSRGTTYNISFNVKLVSGLTNAGNDLAMTWKTTKVTDLYVKSTNTQINGTMSESFDLLQQVWIVPSAPIDSIDAIKYYNNGVGSVTPDDNLTGANLLKSRLRLSAAGDTIFWTPVDTLQLGTTYGLEFEVTLKTGEQFTTNELTAVWKTKAPQSVSVIASNTRSSDGSVIDTFGLQQEIYVVSSVPFTSVTEVNNYAVGGIAIPADMRVLANVRTSGDTIFFKPAYNLGSGTQYAVSFDVTLANGQSATTNELYALWKTNSGIKLVSANDMNAGLTMYRVFKNVGDSLVATFNQAVDTSKTFSTNFGTAGKLTYSWSSNLKTVTIKDTSRLANVKTYAVTPDYSPNGTGQYNNITFTLTSASGEVKAPLTANTDFTGLRPDLEIHTEVALAVIDASYLQVHNSDAVVAGDLEMTNVATTANITITFNRAIDTALVKAAYRDAYFTLVDAAATTVPLDYAISFSADAKTVTINPVADFTNGAIYNVKVVGVVDNSSRATYTGLAAGNYLTTGGFTVQATATVTSIATLATTIAADTTTTANVLGKRIGTSPMAAAAGVYGNAMLNTESVLNFRILEAAWNASHADSVDRYQWRVRKISHAGVVDNWQEVNPVSPIATVAYLTTMGGAATNQLNANRSVNVNPSTATTVLGGNIVNSLRTADNDGAAVDYTNGANMFNDSSRLELQVRALKDLNSDADFLDAGEFGTWSNSVYFVDNIAPCDSDFVTGANCATIALGGVNVMKSTPAGGLNRAGGAGTYTITLTFPEDMDTSSDASISIWYETALGANTAITTSGAFTSARIYEFTLTLASGQNYTANAPYYSISVAGMKDASGVTIQTYGDTGTAATLILRTDADDTEDLGSNNIQGLSSL